MKKLSGASTGFFGHDRPIDMITPGDVDDFGLCLKAKDKLADNTVRRRLGIAKQFFRAACRKEIIAKNPFDGCSTAVRRNVARFYFVTADEARAVLDACLDTEWRLIFSLCRYGGLRCPSEVLRLRWRDVDWEHQRFVAHAAKTEHHEGGRAAGADLPGAVPAPGRRVRGGRARRRVRRDALPRHQAEPADATRADYRGRGAHPVAEAVPEPAQHARDGTRPEFPIHVVCKWLGNSAAVASKHYLQVTDEHYRQAAQKAVQNPVQKVAEMLREGSKPRAETLGKPANRGARLGAAGLEPAASSL